MGRAFKALIPFEENNIYMESRSSKVIKELYYIKFS